MKTSLRMTRLSLAALAAVIIAVTMLPMPSPAAERSLVGVRIFSPIQVVLKKFGDPTFITSGTQLATVNFAPGRLTLLQPTDSGTVPSTQSTDTFNPNPASPDTDTAMGTTTGTNDPFNTLYDHGSRYYYDFAHKGLIYEFVSTSAGRVVEIKVYGYHSPIKTALGIGLGANYAQIVLKYGYPEQTINTQDPEGDILTLIYNQREHVSFQLVRNKLAVISVVAPD